jgi:hypothetical protein
MQGQYLFGASEGSFRSCRKNETLLYTKIQPIENIIGELLE